VLKFVKEAFEYMNEVEGQLEKDVLKFHLRQIESYASEESSIMSSTKYQGEARTIATQNRHG
jgi:hypothetical protein